MNVSSATAAWIAIGAAALALVALLVVVWLLSRIRRLREGQAVLLGDGKTDLVDFAVSLQGRIDDLHRAVDEIAAGLVRVDRRMDGSVTNTTVRTTCHVLVSRTRSLSDRHIYSARYPRSRELAGVGARW